MEGAQAISPLLRAKLEADPFSQHLGVELLEVAPGYARVALTLQPHHTAVQGVTHGGVLLGLAEAALAIACHAHNYVYLALNISLNFHAATWPGDRLIAEARERQAGGHISAYGIDIRDESEDLIASAQAQVYRTNRALVTEEAALEG
jgi:acyl-CoA thioesterase